VVVAAEAGKSQHLQPVAVAAVAVILLVQLQPQRLAAQAVSQRQQAPASTCKASTERLVLAAHITHILAAVLAEDRPQPLLPRREAGRCSVVVVVAREEVRLRSLRSSPHLLEAGLHRVLEQEVRLVHPAGLRPQAMQEHQATDWSVVQVVEVVVRPFRLPRTELQVVLAGLVVVEAVVVVVAAIQDLVVLVVSVVLDTVS
jgi:hypothetical protein